MFEESLEGFETFSWLKAFNKWNNVFQTLFYWCDNILFIASDIEISSLFYFISLLDFTWSLDVGGRNFN